MQVVHMLPYSGTFKLSGTRFCLIEVLNVKSCTCWSIAG